VSQIKDHPVLADTPPPEGNLGHDKNVASSPPVEEYPKGEVVFCPESINP